MSSNNSLAWPECFAKNTLDFSDEPVENVLASQLCAWGNAYMGVPVPNNFFAVMDAASKVTQAFTPDECKNLFNEIMLERRKKSRDNNRGTERDEE